MNCSKCGKKNLKKAKFCKYCGREFTKEEIALGAKKGLVPLIKKIKKWYEACTLKVITDNVFFKIFLLLLFFGISIYNFIDMGANYDIKLLNSERYKVVFNEKEDEYYITLNVSEDIYEKIDLYVPNRINNLSLTLYDENNNVLEDNVYKNGDDIVLKANTSSNNYYIISDKDNKKNMIKVFVYGEVKDNEEEK